MKFNFTPECPEVLKNAAAYQLATGERVDLKKRECSEEAFSILDKRYPGALSSEEPKAEEPEATDPPKGDEEPDPGVTEEESEPEPESEPEQATETTEEPKPAKGKGKGKGKGK